jgi:hypothetical protein
LKIAVLIPSEEYKGYAGARIRYGRLKSPLARHGIQLSLQDIAEFAPDISDADAIIISKCHDARSLVAAAAISGRGLLTGVDLFDDYFSQTEDCRLARYRGWLSQLLPMCDFAICSTPVMANVVGDYRKDLPVHVVNDPAPEKGIAQLPELLAFKLVKARSEQMVRLLWFGVGDNPHFDIGLSDLTAYGGILASLANAGLDLELTILTNERSLDADGLSLIGRLPVRTRVEEWTEIRERELLSEAFACFLPVNAQPFSAAKSLNRAVTALSAGCQVISVGYPLYNALSDQIYGDPSEFLADVERESMKHSAAFIDRFRSAMHSIASPETEAASLAGFLTSLRPRDSEDDTPLILVHGHATVGAAHKTVHKLNGLSVASPYCPAQLGFDVIFRNAPGQLIMLIADKTSKALVPDFRERLKEEVRLSDKKYWRVSEGFERGQSIQRDGYEASLPSQLATYRHSLREIRALMAQAFGPCRVIVSESSSLPFSEAR